MPYPGPPGVQVTQIFQSASAVVPAPDLPACVIGPAHQVVRRAAAGSYDGLTGAYAYPALKPAAQIDVAEVRVEIRLADLTRQDVTDSATVDAAEVDLPDGLSRVVHGPSSTGTAADRSFVDPNGSFVSDDVRAGDFVASGANEYEVSEVLGETELTLLVAPTEPDPITYTVIRKLTGTVLISYVALRTDDVVGRFLAFSSEDEIRQTFGPDALDDPRSVLPFGLARAFRNAGSATFAFVADGTLPEPTAHGAAMDELATKRVYHLAPLTYTPSVLAAWIGHVNTRSTATAKAWRRVYLSQQIAQSEEIATGGDGATDATGMAFTSAAAQFLTKGVKPGDDLVLEDEPEPNVFGVLSTDSETQLTLDAPAPTDLAAQAFTVRRSYTRTQMAANLRALGLATADARVHRVAPDRHHLTVDGQEVIVPGYFAAAARAGYAAAQPIGRPHTFGVIAGFDGISRSNDFFTEEQLNTIAEGGIELLIQKTANAPVQIRDALTTDMSAFNKQNVSMVISRDWLAYIMHDVLAPQVGRYTITERFLNILRGSVFAVFDKALGLPDQAFTGLQLLRLEKNPSQAGTVDIEIAVEQGEPGKYIHVALVF